MERWIEEDDMGFQIGMLRAQEGVGGGAARVRFSAVGSEVHLHHSSSRRFGLQAEDENVFPLVAVGFDEHFGLNGKLEAAWPKK
jgi:hypothetical protein